MRIGNLQIVPFDPEHLRQLTPRSFEGTEMELLGDYVERSRQYLKLGPAYTGIIDGQIMMCAGVFPLWRGVAETWLVTTPLVPQYPVCFHRAISRMLAILEKGMDLWRIQTALHWRHKVSHKWVKRLGFRWEGEMPGYGPDGETYIRFGRVRKKVEGGDNPCHS